MKIQINITKEVLEKTKMCSAFPGKNCAIAYAIREIFPYSVTGRTEILINNKKPDYYISGGWFNTGTQVKLPLKAQGFIKSFDKSNPIERVKMEPFSFEIDVPDEVIESIGIEQVYKILEESTTLELVK